jgi:hypothetical protein
MFAPQSAGRADGFERLLVLQKNGHMMLHLPFGSVLGCQVLGIQPNEKGSTLGAVLKVGSNSSLTLA